ncbi:universal stress protein [Cecembia calidifontis]|uniref:Nucleotide-binding universal stress UspA family protein n=1 Tax=Cecembia calidifontis TaxID=1187080 RepID=A0A4V2F6Y6_9BACT|nr:universal stress protein [Cecembia calidifontis]RZS97949.1 nucleotide-binding universal stress UspA family protein [Cecembia calidifontis]
MKRIIVPIDFSSYADSAFLTALKIADKENSSITCVNVVNSALDWKNLSADKKKQHPDILDAEAEAKDKLKAYVMEHKLGGVPVESVVGVGVPHEIILDVANKHKADLIVLGAHGKEHSKEKFVGSNLQKVIRNADCPVLAVKKAMNGNHLRKMVFASMFNEESKPAFVKMKPFIKAFHTSVHFLFVNTPSAFVNSSEAQKRMDHYAKGLEDMVIHKHIYCHQEPEKGIIEFAESHKIGFIGIASSDRTGKSSYQIGVTDTVLYKTEIPVLSVKFE